MVGMVAGILILGAIVSVVAGVLGVVEVVWGAAVQEVAAYEVAGAAVAVVGVVTVAVTVAVAVAVAAAAAVTVTV
jgi:hypothetical protein